MTIVPVPGFYPDPAGSTSLRWWDGERWTTQLSAPAAPVEVVPPPPVSPPPARVVTAYSTLDLYPQTRRVGHARAGSSASAGRVVLIGVLSLALLVAGAAGWHSLSSRSSAAAAIADAPAADPAPVPDPPVVADSLRALVSTPEQKTGDPVVTPALAKQVAVAYWSMHEPAVVSRDLQVLAALDTGTAAAFEIGSVACGCRHIRVSRPLLGHTEFVPRQTTYPAHFMAAIQTYDPPLAYVELLVFTKTSAGQPWLVELDSGYEPGDGQLPSPIKPVVDKDGFMVPLPAAASRRGAGQARAVAALWQSTLERRRVAAHPGLNTLGQGDRRLAQISSLTQDFRSPTWRRHIEFAVNPSDPRFEFNAVESALVCQPVREEVTLTPVSGGALVQDKAGKNFGPMLPPGTYSSAVNHVVWETCFAVPRDAHVPVGLVNQTDGGGTYTAQAGGRSA